MITYLLKLIKDRRGALSIEFAGVFFVFVVLTYTIYDIYSSIMLQNKLDRATYTVASLFRERSALYPTLDDSVNGNLDPSLSLCASQSCFKTNELFNPKQISELQLLAQTLLNKDVSIKVDSLFILQSVNAPANVNDAQLVNISLSTCDAGSCSDEIKDYFASLPVMTDTANTSTNYSALVPFVQRTIDSSYPFTNIYGRWIPLYRVNMCISNDESLYLKLFSRTRAESDIMPNLCSEVVVISRCNYLDDPNEQCPIYIY